MGRQTSTGTIKLYLLVVLTVTNEVLLLCVGQHKRLLPWSTIYYSQFDLNTRLVYVLCPERRRSLEIVVGLERAM